MGQVSAGIGIRATLTFRTAAVCLNYAPRTAINGWWRAMVIKESLQIVRANPRAVGSVRVLFGWTRNARD